MIDYSSIFATTPNLFYKDTSLSKIFFIFVDTLLRINATTTDIINKNKYSVKHFL